MKFRTAWTSEPDTRVDILSMTGTSAEFDGIYWTTVQAAEAYRALVQSPARFSLYNFYGLYRTLTGT